ncbi:hypothetical protein C900_03003 [Fulvivirga imtechensis AK7]|uniref:Uncharacterized protein n=1 Tax=Fulvivirga imtechensis AK7 TaxID=1237149 RepID=L8JUH0_9BACT|nr:baseplate J/gp47 family protein [Fulvivirga imtechensis]ELR71199.1 hypothetical protein C900_03003 [Fulvivirga imtechensis AK7]
MKSDQEKKILSNIQGSSQADRTNTILHHDYVKIDERALADYLAFLYEYSESIRFYNLKNKPAGDWQPFLGSDISVLLSRIAIISPQKLDSRFHELLYQFENELDEHKSHELFLQLYYEVFNLVRMFDEWYRVAHEYNATGSDSALGGIVQNAIEYRLSKKFRRLQTLITRYNSMGIGAGLDAEENKLDKIWFSTPADDAEELTGGSPREQLSGMVKQLTFVFKDFLRGVTNIVNAAPQLLLKSLEHEYHAPQNALLIAFIRLHEHVKNDLNQLTRKHLDYYYFEKLRQSFQNAIPDRAHLHFSLADHIDKFIIKRGTLFAAGVDEDGYDYLYSADHDLELNKAAVTDIKVLYLSKNPLIAEGDKYKLTSNIYRAEIGSADDATIKFDNSSLSFPTFGEEQYALGEKKRSMQMAEIGFALSTPVLLLREGNRSVNVDLKFNLKSMSSLVSFLEDFSVAEKLSADGAFHKVFANAFNIQLSSEEGWHTIENYKVAPQNNWTDGVLRISFELDLAAPAIVPLLAEHVDHNRYTSKWPVMKIALSMVRSMYAYSYLRDLVVEQCEVSVKVSRITGVQAFNNLGKLDVSSPFYPFGTVPNLGSFMLIGHDELFKKPVSDITIDLEWHNLPQREGGFKEYYRKYDPNIANESFKVSLRALSGYEFLPRSPEKTQIFSLFKTKPVKAGEASLHEVAERNTIDHVDIDALQIKPDFKMLELPDYDNTTRAGYLKLELVAPKMGFGHDMYATLFANEVIEKTKPSSKDALDLPNIPFAPQLRSIQLSYQASSKIYLEKSATRRSNPEADERFYHLHPFGTRTIFKNSIPYDHFLLPQFDDNGYLFIGLSGVQPPSSLTLYFLLEQRAGNNFDIEIPTVHWQYLSEDRWIDFSKSDVIFDTTSNFTVSGIVKLLLPADITQGNHILPGNKHWISARVEGDVNLLSRTKAVFTQALSVTWVPHRDGAQWKQNIPADTIQRLIQPRSEIAGIFQPATSFSGSPQEDLKKYYARVSERLRHKNRAVTAWDYEKLILEKFPFIDRVKCITPIESNGRVKGGEVVVVVVPAIDRQSEFYLPKINYHTLTDIQRYVLSVGSSFLSVRVVNPIYEQVKINCKIKFIDNNKKGEYLQQLHEDLRRFICPWFYSPSSRMNFGGAIRHEEVLTFLESLDYITFITKLSVVIVHYDNEEYSLSDSMDESKTLYASAPWCVLAPMDRHQISILEKTIHETPERAAIESMRLGGDFVVTGERQDDLGEDFPPYRKGDDKDYFVVEIDI